MSLDEQVQALADRLAITDVIIRYFELVDAKGWDQMDEVFTEDTTARWTPDSVMEGRANIVDAMRHMSGSSEIVTYHHVAAMTSVSRWGQRARSLPASAPCTMASASGPESSTRASESSRLAWCGRPKVGGSSTTTG